MKVILPHHSIELNRDENLVVTTFLDGTQAHACPHETPEYHAHAVEKSGSDDILLYCWQHDLMHCIHAEIFHRGPSPTLWAVAHELPTQTPEIQADERSVQDFQVAFMMRGSFGPEVR